MSSPLDIEGQDPLEKTTVPLSLETEAGIPKRGKIRHELLHCLSPVDQIDPALIPSQPARFDPQKVQEWLESDPSPVVRALKEKILQNVQHIPFGEFVRNLHAVTEKLNEQLVSKNEQYAVLWDYKPHASRRWTYELAKPFLQKKPAIETYFHGSAEPTTKALTEAMEKGIRHFVIFDDASYSGSQLEATLLQVHALYRIHGKPTLRFIIVTPYITSHAASVLSKPGVTVLSAKTMPYARDILSEEERAAIAEHHFMDCEKRAGADFFDEDVTLTFFDHRVADDWSFAERLRPLIGTYQKPYRKDHANSYSQKETQEFGIFWQPMLESLYPHQQSSGPAAG